MKTIFISLGLIIFLIFISGCESGVVELEKSSMFGCSVGCDIAARDKWCVEVVMGYETSSLNDTTNCSCYLKNCMRSLDG